MRFARRLAGTRRTLPRWIALLAIAGGLAGCLHMPAPSPAMPAPPSVVRAEWSRMADEPTRLERPLVVIDGWLPLGGVAIADDLRALTGADPDRVLVVTYGLGHDFEDLSRLVVERVEERWPSGDPGWTTEVDVVGFSAGGIVPRVAYLAPEQGPDRKRLRVARLFTIASPHRGTRSLARLLAPDASSRQMRPGSQTLTRLDEAAAEAGYDMVCYGQLNDQTVGATRTAPPGKAPVWTDGQMLASHIGSARNKRFLTDIALRLRGEAPLAAEPSMPPHD